jgi:LuxR family maltose regulon positive regulatory protein
MIGPAPLPLSKKELQILRHLAMGLSQKEICQVLNIKASTCKSHLTSIYMKLDVHNRVQAIRAAHRAKYIEAYYDT